MTLNLRFSYQNHDINVLSCLFCLFILFITLSSAYESPFGII